MAKTAAAARGVDRGADLDPISRLEDKVKQLVDLVGRLKADAARTSDENERLTRELESLRGRLAASDGLAAEVATLKEERTLIRTRVTGMLDQLDALNL